MPTATMGHAPAQPEARPTWRRLRRGQVIGGVLLLVLMMIVLLAAFGPFPWQLLGQGTLLLAVIVVVLLALGTLLISLLIAAITRRRIHILP